ncbi:MAG: hypothetical protein JWN78_2879 [Bacteroidota bacterium]|nr:hypothetical protein [Bacteroidota bacterium]
MLPFVGRLTNEYKVNNKGAEFITQVNVILANAGMARIKANAIMNEISPRESFEPPAREWLCHYLFLMQRTE